MPWRYLEMAITGWRRGTLQMGKPEQMDRFPTVRQLRLQADCCGWKDARQRSDAVIRVGDDQHDRRQPGSSRKCMRRSSPRSGSPSDLRRAIARAVRQLREAMEKEDNCAVTAAHVRNLKEIDPEALARAYALAEKTCTYWPTPGQIRELAGWSEESQERGWRCSGSSVIWKSTA